MVVEIALYLAAFEGNLSTVLGRVDSGREKTASEGIAVRHHQSSVVLEVIPLEPVPDRGLRGDGLQGRMGAEGGHGGVESRVG